MAGHEECPEKIHKIITAKVKGIVTTAMFGVEFLPNGSPIPGLSLEEQDKLAL